MTELFGRTFTKAELLAYVGHISQVGGIRPIELVAGRERGVRGFEVTTGTGLSFTVLADRALDITRASFRGRSLGYLTPSGEAHPAYYEPQGAGWLRTFPGGLLTTCGLTAVGAPGEDAGEACGLHGRISHLPAEELGYWGEWQGDAYWMHITGTMTEAVIFGHALRLTRRISAKLGANTILIEDTVTNMGGAPAPHMLLYHCNLGFPLLSPEATFVTQSRSVTPRDADAAAGLETFRALQSPTVGYREQVFYHDMAADHAGDVRVALVNPALDGGLGLGITYRKHTLPQFVQWKMMGHGTYVLGLEPSNCYVGGRAEERAAGRLVVLQPGEERQYRLELRVLDGMHAMEEFTRTIRVGDTV